MNVNLEELAHEIATRIGPPIPIERQLWTSDDAAAYLRVSRRTVAERYAARPDFPKAIPLPSEGSGKREQRRWPAIEVINWAMKRQRSA